MVLVFLLLALWVTSTIAAIVLFIALEKMLGFSFSDALYTWSAVIGLILASGLLILAACAFAIGLPFSEIVCHSLGMNSPS